MLYPENNDDDRSILELLGDPDFANRNSDLTTEDVRALLAEEITPEDIYWRRRLAKAEKERADAANRHAEEVRKLMPKFANTPTRSLLFKFRSMRTFRYDDGYEVEVDAMRAVLNTREHVPTGPDRKSARRAAAKASRGQGKSKNR
jgi:hypothetical protein